MSLDSTPLVNQEEAEDPLAKKTPFMRLMTDIIGPFCGEFVSASYVLCTKEIQQHLLAPF